MKIDDLWRDANDEREARGDIDIKIEDLMER